MGTGKIDWKRHAAIYAAEYAPKGVSIAEYAEQNELNKNTARRYLRAGDHHADHSDDHVGDHPSDHVSDHAVASKSTKKGKTAKAAPDKGSRAKKASGERAKTRTRSPDQGQKGRDAYTDDHLQAGLPSFVDRGSARKRRPQVKVPIEVMRRIRKTSSTPNSAPITHGGYADIPDEMWDAALDIPDEEIDFWNVRGAMATLMTLVKRRQEVERFYAGSIEGERLRDKDEDGSDEAPVEVQLLKSACSGVDLEVMLRGYIRSQRQGDLQSQIRLMELETKAEERRLKATIQKQVWSILAKRDATGQSAGDTCRLIERIGGTVPPSLLKEYEFELKTTPPDLDDLPGSSPDEFNQEVDQYLAAQHALPSFLEGRRSEVANMVDSLGMGDDSADSGSMLSVGLLEADDGEEWESDEDSALYSSQTDDSLYAEDGE
ncbi:hypothetical protein [Edwardsiella tarda]|uniref:hypothetical protein n=1 Tax=Edwardsiella tarda TaxID=636 RepID=UPI00351CAD8F